MNFFLGGEFDGPQIPIHNMACEWEGICHRSHFYVDVTLLFNEPKIPIHKNYLNCFFGNFDSFGNFSFSCFLLRWKCLQSWRNSSIVIFKRFSFFILFVPYVRSFPFFLLFSFFFLFFFVFFRARNYRCTLWWKWKSRREIWIFISWI